MRDNHFLKEKDEFLFLYRFNLMEYFKIYNEYHPNKKNMTQEVYDTPEAIQNKVSMLINFDKPARINPEAYPISLTMPSKELTNIAELDVYIEELNKRRGGFVMASMVYKQPATVVKNMLNAQIFDIMYKHNMHALQDEAERAIEYIVDSCELSLQQSENFYRDLLNNSNALKAVLAILDQTCVEFITQIFDTQTAEKQLAFDCGCWHKELNKAKDKYVRKSFALKVAYNALDYQPMLSLWVYHCPSSAGKGIWHMTKQNQR